MGDNTIHIFQGKKIINRVSREIYYSSHKVGHKWKLL